MRRIMMLTLLALALPMVALANSFTITVQNDSFEILPPGGLPEGCGLGCHFSQGVGIPGWTTTGATGQHQWGTQLGNDRFFEKLPHGDGITSAWSNGGTISQTVGTVQAGVTYTLTLELGNNKLQPFTAAADLMVGGTDVADAHGHMPHNGHFGLFTAKFTGTAAQAGEPITIQLKAHGPQGVFDSVHLTCDTPGCNKPPSVPEPSTLMMLGAGLLPLFGIVRRTYLKG